MDGALGDITRSYRRHESIILRPALLNFCPDLHTDISAGLFYFCRLFGIEADLVPEVGRWDGRSGVDISGKDYLYKKFYRQKELEESYPQDLEVIIYQSPLIMGVIRSALLRGDAHPISEDLFKLAWQYKERYTHFLLLHSQSLGEEEQKAMEILNRLRLSYTVVNDSDDVLPLQIMCMLGAVTPISAITSQKEEPEEVENLEVAIGSLREGDRDAGRDDWPLAFLQ